MRRLPHCLGVRCLAPGTVWFHAPGLDMGRARCGFSVVRSSEQVDTCSVPSVQQPTPRLKTPPRGGDGAISVYGTIEQRSRAERAIRIASAHGSLTAVSTVFAPSHISLLESRLERWPRLWMSLATTSSQTLVIRRTNSTQVLMEERSDVKDHEASWTQRWVGHQWRQQEARDHQRHPDTR